MEELGLLDKIEPHTHTVPHGDRSGVVIEPFLTEQWYVNAKELAKQAISAVRDGKTVFVPRTWEKTYFEWMENIQPWCISRQLWWGHQIPAWYGPVASPDPQHQQFVTQNRFVALDERGAIEQAEVRYRPIFGPDIEVQVAANAQEAVDAIADVIGRKSKIVKIWRDEDVLDTWFSSALWPFSTLGWPDETPELKRYYPTNVLVTGFDIIFFWVARMMMMGLQFRHEIPFETVYIHALVRDEKGAKMSKSKGNVMDPLDLIDGIGLDALIEKRVAAVANKADATRIAADTRRDYPKGISPFGADALRFTLAAMAAQGRDIKLSTQRVEGYRNFATKLWNACRFAEMNQCATVNEYDPRSLRGLINKWIVTQLADTLGNVEKALADYRFNDAANAIYQFVWNLYCDWYLELAKPVFVGQNEEAKAETQATVAYVRDEILKILHPFMPFITEELWQLTAKEPRDALLALTQWPSKPPYFSEAYEETGWLIDLVSAIRSVRAEMNVPPSALIQLALINPSQKTQERARYWDDTLNRLARISGTAPAESVPRGAVQLVVRGEIMALPLKGVIDLDAERARLQKELGKAEADIKRVDAKLANEKFVANAPEEVVEEEKEKREEAQGRKAKIVEALDRLKQAG